MKAIRIRESGGPERLEVEELPSPDPPPGHVRIRVVAAGVNFIDIYQRTGLYPVELPYTPGLEVAGEVDAIGPGVSRLRVGDRVASVQARGGYAEQALAAEDQVVALPEGTEPQTAAAALLQGMTAHYLVHDTFPLQVGQTCLVHAAAGGVGLLLVQMAAGIGARVLGTVSTEDKARLALEAGADRVIQYTREDFEEAVKRETDGRGVAVVYDSVGQATFDKSLRCLAPLGMLALYGQSSGSVAPVDPGRLAAGGSLFLTRPILFDYIRGHASLQQRATDVLGQVAGGRLSVRIDRTCPLADAAEAHCALEGRRTAGKVLLTP